MKKRALLILSLLLVFVCLFGSAIAAEETDCNKLDYFSNSRIGMLTGASFDKMILSNPHFKNCEILYFNSKTDCINAILNGKIDAMPHDLPIALYMANTTPGLYVVEEPIMNDNYGIALQKNSPYKEGIDAALKQMKADGTYDKLFDLWFGADESIKHCIKMDWEGKNGTIRFMSDFEAMPLAYLGENEEPLGFEIDLFLHAAKQMDYKVEFVTGNISGMIASLGVNKIDAAAMGVSITEERLKLIDFSEPTMEGAVVLLALEPNYTSGSSEGLFQSIVSSFERTFISENRWKLFAQGALNTLIITFVGVLCGTILGFGIYLFCRRTGKIGEKIGKVLSWFFNGIPVVVLLMILFYVIFAKSSISGIVVACIGFTLLFAIYFFDMMYLAISTLGNEQVEAAYALGYNDTETFFRILFPQALPRFLPSYRNAINNILKGTSVVGYIAVDDLTRMSDIVRSRTFDAILPLVFIAILYFLMEGITNVSLRRLERKIKQRSVSLCNIMSGVKKHD